MTLSSRRNSVALIAEAAKTSSNLLSSEKDEYELPVDPLM